MKSKPLIEAMATRLQRLNRHLIRGMEWLVTGITGILVVDVLWQVAARYLLSRPSAWTDELATLLVIWIALLGATVAFARQDHLGVDYFVHRFPTRWRRWAEVFAHLTVALFAVVVLGIGGIKLVVLTWMTNQVSPALQIKIAYIYLALPLSGLVLFLVTLEQVRVSCCPPSAPNPRNP